MNPVPSPQLLVWITGFILFSAFSVVAGCMLGPLSLPVTTVLGHLTTLVGSGQAGLREADGIVIIDIRLSRLILAWLVGASLAGAGAVFQGILQNPLADPFTLGVSTGAAFGASVAIFSGVAAIPVWWGLGVLPLAALAGALLALAVVMTLGRVAGRLRRETVVLAGIVTATFLSALISLVKSLDEESLSSIVFWVMGSLQGRGWEHVLFAAPYMLLALCVLCLLGREIDLLCLGDEQARMLGLNADKIRLVTLAAASLLTGAAVAVSGVIGFVGLVIPHIIRMRFGASHRPLIVLSALAGGCALLWSDVVARILLPHGQELPVGVVTALAGGPFFCFLLRSKNKETGL